MAIIDLLMSRGPTNQAPSALPLAAYRNLLLYYFSGTGNALTATRWIRGHAEQRGIPTHVYNIEDLAEPAVPELSGRTLIGFCYPTHGFVAPWIMLKFWFRFPKLADADVFFLNTRAGFRFLWLHAGPGLSGIAQWLPILWFGLRGHRIAGSLPLDMPHSWISFFWPNTQQGIQLISARCRRIVHEFCDRVLEGRRTFRWSVWLTLPLDLAVAPIAIPYLFLGRYVLAKTLFASYTCNDCQLCVKSCPVGAIEIKGGRPYWKYTCESCMRCMNICPRRAIQSWVTRIALATYGSFALGMALYPMDPNLWLLILTVLLFPLYRLLHSLWRIRAINAAFTYTSLTRVWHRYLAPGVKAKDLQHRSP